MSSRTASGPGRPPAAVTGPREAPLRSVLSPGTVLVTWVLSSSSARRAPAGRPGACFLPRKAAGDTTAGREAPAASGGASVPREGRLPAP
ncbi:hypothetical protein GCM10027168_56530 [Streptomyces capparidis]